MRAAAAGRVLVLLVGLMLAGGALGSSVAVAKPDSKPDKAHHAKKADHGPGRPSLGASVRPGGLVVLSVRADRGTRVVVRDGGSTVAAGRATGSFQSYSFHTSGGSHTYTARATDRKGRTSPTARLTVYVDTTPPPLGRLAVVPGTPEDSRSSVTFDTDVGTGFTVLVDGKQVSHGTTRKPHAEILVEAADGRHRVRLELRDAVGNVTSGSRSLTVDVPRLTVAVKVVSRPTRTVQLLQVRSTPNATAGVVRMPNGDAQPFPLTHGRGTLRLRLQDGTYEGVRIAVRDPQGRTGSSAVDAVVDATAPRLTVTPEESLAADGRFGATISTDEGAEVSWRLVGAGSRVVDTGTFEAGARGRLVERDVEAGSYRIEVTATDSYGRATTARAVSRVAVDPPPPVGLYVLLVALGLAVAGGGYALVRRRSARSAVDEGPGQDGATRARRDALVALLDVAEQGHTGPVPDLPGVGLLPGERPLHVTSARLFETAGDDGRRVTLQAYDGHLVVTDLRLAFVAGEQWNWWWSLVDAPQHDAAGRVLLRRHDDPAWSGLECADPVTTRLVLDLAMAPAGETREALLADVRRELDELESAHPWLAAPATTGLVPVQRASEEQREGSAARP